VRLRIDLKRFIFPMLIALSALLFIGASCGKKDSNATDPDGLVKAIDAAQKGSGTGSGTVTPGPLNRDPIPGVDVSKLSEKEQTLFFEMADSLSSPCGKAHSLRTSVTTDKECKRAPFAAKYLALLVEAGAPKDVVKEFYGLHYDKVEPKKFDVDESMEHIGPPDAAIQIVEFFDYGCPHCAEFAPVIKESIAAFPDDIVIYFKHYVLGKFVGSELAAQAAIAAGKQKKFVEMHELLFEKQSMAGHTKDKVFGYAESLGLNMKQFAADFETAKVQIEMDHALGEAVGVESTPAIFINGRDYKGPAVPDFMKLWLEEELAVNR
jgi:protein-disulfide isomerase